MKNQSIYENKRIMDKVYSLVHESAIVVWQKVVAIVHFVTYVICVACWFNKFTHTVQCVQRNLFRNCYRCY